MKQLAGAPCELEVPDEELWGLKGGLLQATVFDWRGVDQAAREPFLLHIFGDPVASRYLTRLGNDLVVANPDLVPFVLLGKPGFNTEGFTFETRLDTHLVGVLFLDLDHAVSALACPILLWDMKRFGKVASDINALKVRMAAGGPVSAVVVSMPLRVFHRVIAGRVHYWQIEVSGRHVKMQRGQFKPDGQRDWATNELREANFASSAEAKARADELVQKYVRDGYYERKSVD